jgi:hypothetical protein
MLSGSTSWPLEWTSRNEGGYSTGSDTVTCGLSTIGSLLVANSLPSRLAAQLATEEPLVSTLRVYVLYKERATPRLPSTILGVAYRLALA